MLPALLTIAGVHLIALASPGPDVFIVMQTAASRSRKEAFCCVLGISLALPFGLLWLCSDFSGCSTHSFGSTKLLWGWAACTCFGCHSISSDTRLAALRQPRTSKAKSNPQPQKLLSRVSAPILQTPKRSSISASFSLLSSPRTCPAATLP